LLYYEQRSAFKASLVMLAVPFSAIGAVWLFYILGYNVSIAAWVGRSRHGAGRRDRRIHCCCSSIFP